MSNCVLCRVLDGTFEGSFIYRGEKCSALLDISPLSEGHTLVVPNDHVARMNDLDPDLGAEMFSLATRVQQAMMRSRLNMTGANLFLSDGAEAGQEIAHLHIHIVPRRIGDGVRLMQGERAIADRGVLDSVAKEIASYFK